MIMRDGAKVVLDKQAGGESCVGCDVLNSRMSATADCTWHKHCATYLCVSVFVCT